eukprot:3559484-Amphidinium_carterae.1
MPMALGKCRHTQGECQRGIMWKDGFSPECVLDSSRANMIAVIGCWSSITESRLPKCYDVWKDSCIPSAKSLAASL